MKENLALLQMLGARLVLLAGFLAMAVRAEPRFESSTNHGASSVGTTARLTSVSAPGAPWGELEIKEFSLELSDELLPEAIGSLRIPKWRFAGVSLTQVTNFLRSCRFSETDLGRLMEEAECEFVWPSDGHAASMPLATALPLSVTLSPPADLVLNLGWETRHRIHSTLANDEPEHRPGARVRIQGRQPEQWLAQTGLSAERLAQVSQTAVWQGPTSHLINLETLQQLLTAEEMKKVLKAVYRNPTFVLRLQLSAETDLDTVSRYWGRGGRARTIKPFLEGMSRTAGRASVNIAFLLPAFARTHLYTFPDSSKEPVGSANNGLWTALNFFNDQPDNRFLDRNHARQTLLSQFEPGASRPAYGDLVALYLPDGELVHVGVYIAEDFVFTRSGIGDLQPWVLMKLPEMVRRFQTTEQLATVIHHRKQT